MAKCRRNGTPAAEWLPGGEMARSFFEIKSDPIVLKIKTCMMYDI
jgi:hypothetical protein